MDGASHIHQHAHEHQHDHGHVHDHGHKRGHAAPARAPASLLRMSAAERLAVAGGAVAAIWMGVFWALA
jgi:hypothetical protein